MKYIIDIENPRYVAAIDKQLAAYNAGQEEADTLTAEQYLATQLPLPDWADRHAPAAIPLGDWLQRWTEDEREGALQLAGANSDIRALWLKLIGSQLVHLDHESLLHGVPLVCAALEKMGKIEEGQAAVRATAITAY